MNFSLRLDLGERRTYLDPHGGKNTQIKAGLARAALVTIARDRWNRIWVLDAWAERAKTVEMVDKVVEHFHHWHPGIVGIECAGQQTLFVDTTREILRLRGQSFIPIEGVPVSTRQGEGKVYRIRTVLQPVIAAHRLLVRDDLIELRAEIASFPTGATMDIVDALAGAVSMLPVMTTPEEEAEAGPDLYREYLHECGLTDDQITDRMLEEFGENDSHPHLGAYDG